MLCTTSYVAAGTAVTTQTPGNCQKIVCDGHGALTLQEDDTNVPNDNNPCTKDLCTKGMPSNPPVSPSVTCGGALTCDGAGHCTGCQSPADCPGMETDCEERSCTSGVCGYIYAAAGKPVSMQTAGPCKQNVCNGMGQVSIVFDPTNVPAAPGPCVTEGCSMGAPTQSNTAAGVTCSQGGVACDGNGACVACLNATMCPGQDTECKIRTCTANACTFSYAAANTPLSMQTPGDCQTAVCDGKGNVTSIPDDTDLPTNGTTCDIAQCKLGVPSLMALPSGTACGTNKTCNGSGQCTGCTDASQCPGTSNSCQTVACTAGVCGFSYTAKNTPTPSQTAGDCKQNVCDGAGNTVSIVDDADLPTTSMVCYVGVCSNGVPSTAPAIAGTACASGGGTQCNGTGACGVCKPGTLRSCACTIMTVACCASQELTVPCDPLIETCVRKIEYPIGGCCCIESQSCLSSGEWGPCG
jgi:hypothetical protein